MKTIQTQEKEYQASMNAKSQMPNEDDFNTSEEDTKCDVIRLGNNEEYKDQLTDDELHRLRMVENFAKVAQAIHTWEKSLSTEDQ